MLGRRRMRGAGLQYHVRWKGLTVDDDSWESGAGLLDPDGVIEQYDRANPP
eukprot:COSAG01_NODE_70758_length_257_cov_4.424051_1_plen_50_part_10